VAAGNDERHGGADGVGDLLPMTRDDRTLLRTPPVVELDVDLVDDRDVALVQRPHRPDRVLDLIGSPLAGRAALQGCDRTERVIDAREVHALHLVQALAKLQLSRAEFRVVLLDVQPAAV
jgi:hypothetical protein